MSIAERRGRLQQLGYLPAQGLLSIASIDQAERAYRAFHELQPTVDLDAHLALPRCGCPDIMAAGTSRPGWNHKPVRVRADFSIGNISKARVQEAFHWSLERWAAESGFEWVFHTSGAPNIDAAAGRIDGNSNTLAWSMLPTSSDGPDATLQQKYDSADSVLTRSFEFFRAVVLHELGHALGLEHTNDKSAIMYPMARDEQLDLGGNDVPRIQGIYGRRATPPPPPPPPSGPTDPPTTGPLTGWLTVDGITYRITGQRMENRR